jgi:hypothetical protein
MPLDAKLSWIDLTDAERTQLLEMIGPERLRASSVVPFPLARPTS